MQVPAPARTFPRTRAIAWLAGVASALAYGVTPVAAATAFIHGVTPLVLVCLRGFIGAAVILGLVAATGRLGQLTWRPCVGLLALCGPLFGAQIVLYFAAIQSSGAQLPVIVSHVYPVFVIALVWLQTRIPVPRAIVALCVALGAGIVLVAGTADAGQDSLKGAGLAALSAAGYALYFVLSERWVHQTGAVAAAGLVTLGSAVSIGLVALGSGAGFSLNHAGWLSVTLQGLMLIPVGFCGSLYAVRVLGSVSMSMLGLLEPIVAILLAAALLHEQLTPTQWIGVVVVMAACGALPWVVRTSRTDVTCEFRSDR